MPRRDAVCMRRYPLLPRSLHRFDRRARFGLTTLAAMAIAGLLMPAPPARPAIQLVRGSCGAQDWLVVADRQHDRISAYDAHDGRPLGRLDQASARVDVDRLVPEGCWLVVLGDGEPQAMHLPELRPQPLALALGERRQPRYAESDSGAL
jgi:hypothetical protein